MRQVSVLFVNMSLPHNVYDAAQAVQKAYKVIYETVRGLKGELKFANLFYMFSCVVKLLLDSLRS